MCGSTFRASGYLFSLKGGLGVLFLEARDKESSAKENMYNSYITMSDSKLIPICYLSSFLSLLTSPQERIYFFPRIATIIHNSSCWCGDIF